MGQRTVRRLLGRFRCTKEPIQRDDRDVPEVRVEVHLPVGKGKPTLEAIPASDPLDTVRHQRVVDETRGQRERQERHGHHDEDADGDGPPDAPPGCGDTHDEQRKAEPDGRLDGRHVQRGRQGQLRADQDPPEHVQEDQDAGCPRQEP